jgi:hypothetical protein
MLCRAQARGNSEADDASPRGGAVVRTLVPDIASFEDPDGFDLIAMLNMPRFFDRVGALLRPGGFVVNASSYYLATRG